MFRIGWKPITGTVIQIKEDKERYNPVFEYEIDNKKYRCEVFERNIEKTYNIGDKINLIYNPKRLMEVRVKKEKIK